MHLDEAIKMFKLLPVNPARGLSIKEIVTILLSERPGKTIPKNEYENLKRRVQHYIFELQEYDGGLVRQVDAALLVDKRTPKYYLNVKNVARWFMTEGAALNNIFTRDVINGYFLEIPELNLDQLNLTADAVLNEANMVLRNVSKRIRMVPDGIRRLKARIRPDVLQATYKALGGSKQLEMRYISSANKVTQGLFSPYGLVAKDGTLYLIAKQNGVEGLKSYPLHRVEEARLTANHALVPQNFDIDDYIEQTGNLSHVLYDEKQPIELVLNVEPQTIYHFEEKPLSENQTIEKLGDSDMYVVKATILNTLLLVPFLLSMGGWIEVVSPESVRNEIAERLKKAVAHYS